jgi:hypothetical protein
MLEGSQLRLSNNISLLSVYLSFTIKKEMVRILTWYTSYRKNLIKFSDFLTYQENTTTCVFLNMVLNILKTPKDLQLSK